MTILKNRKITGVGFALLATFLLMHPDYKAFPIDDTQTFTVNGYYKNLLTTSETISDKKKYIYHLQRYRFEFRQQFTKELSAVAIYDNNLLLNNISHSPDFQLIKQRTQGNLAFWNAEYNVLDSKYLYWTTELYRIYVKYHTHNFEMIAGKQAIDWSRMRFYHPFDLFTPISPLDIEKDEKMGVDSINMTYFPMEFMMMNFIYAPNRDGEQQSFGLRGAYKFGDYDVFLMGAYIKKDKIMGASFDGYVKDAGFRGELTYTVQDNDDKFFRGALEYDISLTRKFYWIVQYFYNGGAKLMDRNQFLGSYEFSRKAMSMTKHIIGTGVEYEMSGVTKFNNYVFFDVERTSIFYNPEFKWNIKPNFDFSLGLQIFGGRENSEYGSYHDLLYTELKFFF